MISGWHDDYRNKDAGHDEMQAAVWRHYHRQIGKRSIKRGEAVFVMTDVIVEFPLIRKHGKGDIGDIIGFADIGMSFTQQFSEEEKAARKRRYVFDTEVRYAFLELKPRIYSVGGVIRQVKALGVAAGKCGLIADVFPMVYRNDPSANLLRELWPSTWTWDSPTPPLTEPVSNE